MPVRLSFSLLIILLSLILAAPIAASATEVSHDVRSVLSPSPSHTSSKAPGSPSPTFNLSEQKCVLPGEVIKFTGDNMMMLADYQLVLRAKKQFVLLKSLSLSDKHLMMQIPRDTALRRGHLYPLFLLAAKGPSQAQSTGVAVRLCPTMNKYQLRPVQNSHESGEILILSHSGITDQIIREGAKLGYLLLRRYQLNSINQTLLVLGGSDRNLSKTIKKLRASFDDAAIDLNHHYFPQGQFSLQRTAVQSSPWPNTSDCPFKIKSRVRVGMLDSDIDMTHPALSAKSIKTRHFLLPSQASEPQHGTAIAVLLIGHKTEHGFQGLVPFIDLKAASVVQKNNVADYATAEAISRAIDWFINEKIQLMNVSLSRSSNNRVTEHMFAESIDRGLIVFAAAGHHGHGSLSAPAYPAALPGVIAITAVDAKGEAPASAVEASYIDFAAPGDNVWTTTDDLQHSYGSVTSFAVPHAVSIAALYLGQQAHLSREKLFKTMQQNAVDRGRRGYDKRYGWGQLGMYRPFCQQ